MDGDGDKVVVGAIDTSMKISTVYSFQSMADMAFSMHLQMSEGCVCCACDVCLVVHEPATLIGIITNLIYARTDSECQRQLHIRFYLG